MRLVNMETSAFLVREKGLDAETLLIIAARLLCCVHITDQIQRLLIPLGPTTQSHHRTIGVTGHLHLLERDEGAWLDTRSQGIEAKGLAFPRRHGVLGRAARVEPA